MPSGAWDKILATAYDNFLVQQLDSPLQKLWGEESERIKAEREQREALLSRAFKLRRRIRRAVRNRWANSRFWLSNAIYKHEESDW